jgi:NADP-dependent 3-hydroxy acid dehydrogenase YdfG
MKQFSLVTGAAGLLGEYHSQALVNLGHNVLMTDIDKELLNTKLKNIKKKK